MFRLLSAARLYVQTEDGQGIQDGFRRVHPKDVELVDGFQGLQAHHQLAEDHADHENADRHPSGSFHKSGATKIDPK